MRVRSAALSGVPAAPAHLRCSAQPDTRTDSSPYAQASVTPRLVVGGTFQFAIDQQYISPSEPWSRSWEEPTDQVLEQSPLRTPALWTLECFRSSILVRPSRHLHRTGDYRGGALVAVTRYPRNGAPGPGEAF